MSKPVAPVQRRDAAVKAGSTFSKIVRETRIRIFYFSKEPKSRAPLMSSNAPLSSAATAMPSL